MTHPLKPVEAALEKIIEDDTDPTSKRIGFAGQDATAALINLRSMMRGELPDADEIAGRLRYMVDENNMGKFAELYPRAKEKNVGIIKESNALAFSAGMSAAQGRQCDDKIISARLDLEWIHGAKAGWNAALSEDNYEVSQHRAAIERRARDAGKVLSPAPTKEG
jgi:hypothetical protein